MEKKPKQKEVVYCIGVDIIGQPIYVTHFISL